MRCGYFDCFNGAAGDMILAALLDAGWEFAALEDVVARLKLPGVHVTAERVKRQGMAALHVQVHDDGTPQPHRHLRHVVEIITQADLPAPVAAEAQAVFARLAAAEAKVHGTTPEKVHFHEVGAVDAIVDIVGGCAGRHALGLERIVCAPPAVGSGTVECAHGIMPVPAPATAELLRGVPTQETAEPGELLTPTGAALLTTWTTRFGPPPGLRTTAIGYGAGTRPGVTRPNVLRLIVGDLVAGGAAEETVVVIETQIDDATGQTVAFACEQLLANGALDAYVVPIIMKKGRPGQFVSVLSRPADADRLVELLLRTTPTLGVRRQIATRTVLGRETVAVATAFGEIRVKLGRLRDAVVQATPEYEDCAAAARKHDVPLAAVQNAALTEWRTHVDADDAGSTG